MDLRRSVARHYSHGTLEQALAEALKAAGKDIDNLAPGDLGTVEEFHIAGRRATIDLAAKLSFPRGAGLLDIGCGLGGASRYFAHEHGCRVDGIDLSEDYIRIARMMAARMGLADRVSYHLGSASDLPFDAAHFDGAYMLHVGMNIADKAAAFSEIRRVLKRGAVFGIYDILRENDGALEFPMPWAENEVISFVETADDYRCHLEAAGFAVELAESRRVFAVDFFCQMRSRMAERGQPPLGLHILMGPTAPQKYANMMNGVERGLIAPTEIVARAA